MGAFIFTVTSTLSLSYFLEDMLSKCPIIQNLSKETKSFEKLFFASDLLLSSPQPPSPDAVC